MSNLTFQLRAQRFFRLNGSPPNIPSVQVYRVGILWAIVQTHYILGVEFKGNSKQTNYDFSRANPLDTKLDGKNNLALT